jgi:hypothetical protein
MLDYHRRRFGHECCGAVFDHRRFSVFLVFSSSFGETQHQGYAKETCTFLNYFGDLDTGKLHKVPVSPKFGLFGVDFTDCGELNLCCVFSYVV